MNSAENVSDEELGRFIRRASLKRFSFAQEAYRIAIALQSLRSPPTEDGDRVEVVAWPPLVDLGRVLGFFASVIKSGEPWTETCQAEYQKANVALQALYASPRPETVGVSVTGDTREAIKRIRDAAMLWTLKGRIPEAGVFGVIAQDADWLNDQFSALSPQEGE